MKNTVAVLIVGGFLASLGVVVAAQATRSVNEGVYTADQAKKGEATYKEQCAACHGDNLEGSGPDAAAGGQGLPRELGRQDRRRSV
jgi:mono/diheme cytochrome c family protein